MDVHITDVEVDHVAVKQVTLARATVVETSVVPKFRPTTVTEALPEYGTFVYVLETTGESKVQICRPVPATAPMVTEE